MRISLIAAMSENGVIGKDNQLPWHIPEELKHFKAITKHKPIIMGRKTFISIGKALPERKNIVLTQDKNFTAEQCVVVHSKEQALAAAKPAEEVMIIGGSQVFAAFLPEAQRLYLSIVHQTLAGDSYFPTFDVSEWKISKEEKRDQFTIRILDRKTKEESL